MTAIVDLLLQRAKWAHPTSARNRKEWIKAAQYLRARGLWILDTKAVRKDAA